MLPATDLAGRVLPHLPSLIPAQGAIESCNLILWVAVFGDSSSGTITGVTYSSVAMTQLPTVSPKQVPGDRFVYLFYLIAPATGANNIVVSAGTGTYIAAIASSYTGAKQSGVPDASANNSCTACTTLSTSVTTFADNSWIVLISKNANSATETADTGSTLRRANASDAAFALFESSGDPVTPQGATSMSIKISTGFSADHGLIMASFAPAVAAPRRPLTIITF